MTLGRYDYERRYRRKLWSGAVKILLALGVVLLASLFSYQMGVEQLKARDAAMRKEVNDLSLRNADLELMMEQMKSAVSKAEAHVHEMEVRLRRDVPTGDRAILLESLTKRLEAGVNVDRLAFVVDHTENPRGCKGLEGKRFALATPIMKNKPRAISLAGGAVTLAGEGESARDADNNPESWFDPAQPVKITLTLLGGKTETLEGVLPQHRSVVANGEEYRFAFVAGARSFVEVSADKCPFP